MGIFALHAQPRFLPTPADWHFTPLTEAVNSTPRWFLGTDGKAHLVYELLLTNALTVPVTVTAVEVRNDHLGAALIDLTGPSLLAAMSQIIEAPDFEWLMIDASHCKVHPHAAGARGGNLAMSRSKGGSTARYIWPWMRTVCRSESLLRTVPALIARKLASSSKLPYRFDAWCCGSLLVTTLSSERIFRPSFHAGLGTNLQLFLETPISLGLRH